MDYYEALASQPANLEQSAATVAAGLAELDLTPWRSGVLALASIGASSHAGHALVHRLNRYGRRAINVDASELVSYGPDANLADSYVFVSEGGRSRETIDAASRVAPGARLGMTNVPSAPISEAVDAVLGMGHGEDSRVYTVGYTATLQAFGLFATALDGNSDGESWPLVPDLVDTTITRLSPAAPEIAALLSKAACIDFVGSGPSRASVTEAALLFRESTRQATATYETYQYLHGPMESLTSSDAVVLFGDDREVALAHYLAGVGVHCLLITSEAVAEEEGLSVLRIPKTAAVSRSILQIVPAQLVAGELARINGLGIDGFLYTQADTKIGPNQDRPGVAADAS